MKRFLGSPLVRISFALVMLTVALLFAAEMLGFVPNTQRAEVSSRKIVAESLAVQLSTAIETDQTRAVDETLRTVVERNPLVRSAAVRSKSGELVADFGNHAGEWTLKPGERSTPTQVQVPLFDRNGHWGNVEVRFAELDSGRGLLGMPVSFMSVILFVALAGFGAYLVFLKRALRELNPDAVIPERVQSALDTLAEGLIILDLDGYIVFANAAFARKLGTTTQQLLGRSSASFDWVPRDDEADTRLPWLSVLESHEPTKGAFVRLTTELDEKYTFMVNASPIMGSARESRGVLITFDDVTEVERKNEELHLALCKLEKSQHELSRQNKELHVLATRDPLSGALNRRSFLEGLAALFSQATQGGGVLCCLMVDIDHFKSVNDRFGHAVGDEVIKLAARILLDTVRPSDLVGRLGGEEFCVVLADCPHAVCEQVAERMRKAMAQRSGESPLLTGGVTASFGMAFMVEGIDTPKVLLDKADQALYAAKNGGRNRVVAWAGTGGKDAATGDLRALFRTVTPETEAGAGQPEDAEAGAVVALAPTDAAVAVAPAEAPVPTASLESAYGFALPDHNLLIDRIDQGMKRAHRYKTSLAVLVMEIDIMQRVCDTLGAAVGQKLMGAMLARLRHDLRDTDTVTLVEEDRALMNFTRFGVNKIALVLTDFKNPETIMNTLGRVFASLNRVVEVDGDEFYPKAHAGISVFPGDGEDAETLLSNASSALAESRQMEGTNDFCFYADDINRRSRKRFKREAELHRALERDEIVVYYQPQYELRSGRISAMEALVRWVHPHHGLVPPNEFIPLAEQTGLIEHITRRVITVAGEQVRRWQQAGHGTIPVAVNLSPVQFANPRLADQIIDCMRAGGIPPGSIELEITESVFVQNVESATAILRTLCEAGLAVSIDDFGTGYSSLSYLKDFPLHKVKIDRSFVAEVLERADVAAIVNAILSMSHNLGIRVVAEGVETEEQLAYLQELRCDEIQGFLMSKPVPREAATELLGQFSDLQRRIHRHALKGGVFVSPAQASRLAGVAGVVNEFPAPLVSRSR